MTIHIQLRAAESADSDTVFRLAQSFATSFNVDAESFERVFNELLQSPDARLLVAMVDNDVVGYLLGFDHLAFFANGRVAWVEEIMVEPDQRRRGIGRILMAEFEHWAASRNARLIALATRRAGDFYRSLGYEESATYYRRILETEYAACNLP
jgi:GNAT superfamily N-acetyltransferase